MSLAVCLFRNKEVWLVLVVLPVFVFYRNIVLYVRTPSEILRNFLM